MREQWIAWLLDEVDSYRRLRKLRKRIAELRKAGLR